MKWLRWGLTLEVGGLLLLLAGGVVGLVAILLFVPGCPVLFALCLLAMVAMVPTSLGRLLCLGAPRESGVHAWLVTALAASAFAWHCDPLIFVAALLNVQVLIVMARWMEHRELAQKGRDLQYHMVAWLVATRLLGGVDWLFLPLWVWVCWQFSSYVILVMDVRGQLVSSR